MLILCMSFMFCTVNGCDCQPIIKENYDDDDDEFSTADNVRLRVLRLRDRVKARVA